MAETAGTPFPTALQIHLTPSPSPSLQAGLDKMSKGHMLADVVAIIGTSLLSGRDALAGGGDRVRTLPVHRDSGRDP